jgi:hypothetical protein
MSELDEAIREVRAAVSELVAAAERAAAGFTTPRAPGKWSPSQVTEHVARALEESANQVRGVRSKLPTLPALARPLVRVLFFNRVIRGAPFRKARTNRPMDPERGPGTPAEARVRLERALDALEDTCRARGLGARMRSPTFGPVTVSDLVRFQAAHTRHHTGQIPAARRR